MGCLWACGRAWCLLGLYRNDGGKLVAFELSFPSLSFSLFACCPLRAGSSLSGNWILQFLCLRLCLDASFFFFFSMSTFTVDAFFFSGYSICVCHGLCSASVSVFALDNPSACPKHKHVLKQRYGIDWQGASQ